MDLLDLLGVGKSCVLQQLINNFHKEGLNIWSTRPFQYARKITIQQLAEYDFNINGVQGGVLILDELGVDMNNRNYKEIDKELLEFFKLYRHYKLNIYVVSQGIDIDITVRRLINRWYILERKYFNFLWIHLKTNFVGLYEVGNFLEIENGDWKQKYIEGSRVGLYDITKSFKQFNSFELPLSARHLDLPYWFDLNIEETMSPKKTEKTYSLFSRLRGLFKKPVVSVPPEEQSTEGTSVDSYANLSREELLDLWKKNQI